MDSIIITPSNEQDLVLLASIAKKMGFKAKILTEEEKEDLGIAYLVSQADRKKKVSKETVLKKLRS